jgi:hypothetical protein
MTLFQTRTASTPGPFGCRRHLGSNAVALRSATLQPLEQDYGSSFAVMVSVWAVVDQCAVIGESFKQRPDRASRTTELLHDRRSRWRLWRNG